jgi:hypothetical protein
VTPEQISAWSDVAGVGVAGLFGAAGLVVGIVGLVQAHRARGLAAEANELAKKAHDEAAATALRDQARRLDIWPVRRDGMLGVDVLNASELPVSDLRIEMNVYFPDTRENHIPVGAVALMPVLPPTGAEPQFRGLGSFPHVFWAEDPHSEPSLIAVKRFSFIDHDGQAWTREMEGWGARALTPGAFETPAHYRTRA